MCDCVGGLCGFSSVDFCKAVIVVLVYCCLVVFVSVSVFIDFICSSI